METVRVRLVKVKQRLDPVVGQIVERSLIEVADSRHNTGRRVNAAYPGCSVFAQGVALWLRVSCPGRAGERHLRGVHLGLLATA